MTSRVLISCALIALCACGNAVTGEPGDDLDPIVNDEVTDEAPSPAPTPPPPDEAAPAPSTFPSEPLTFTLGQALELDSGTSSYWVVVPSTYDRTHNTATQLYVYLHGCGGASSGDVWAASNGSTRWIGMAPGGAEGGCWDDQARLADVVMDAIADLKTHFNIDPKRVHIGGYSSGGDLAYYTAFRHASDFAGILCTNSIPAYSASGLTSGIDAAAWKLNIVHLSQTSDGVYAIADVRARFQTLRDNGFPVLHIERPGTHYDANTTAYRNELVHPHLEDGWKAP